VFTSSAVERATTLSTSPVAGESFSNVPPAAAARSSPSMKFDTVRVAVGAVMLMR
jgi:hypothetical protein